MMGYGWFWFIANQQWLVDFTIIHNISDMQPQETLNKAPLSGFTSPHMSEQCQVLRHILVRTRKSEVPLLFHGLG